MKGIELLASILALMIMIGVGSLFGGIIISVINLSEQPSLGPIHYEMFMFPAYPPVKYETMLLSYLETTEPSSGLQIKKILTYAAYQRTIDSIYIEGETISRSELEQATRDVFEKWLPGGAYLIELKIGKENHVIAKNSDVLGKLSKEVLRIRKISVPLFIDEETYIANYPKNSELPMNIILDFYVQ
ncbi:MAG: hypothetical protein V1818_03790 [Candidatus Aenigmatarchaeota archaeon]